MSFFVNTIITPGGKKCHWNTGKIVQVPLPQHANETEPAYQFVETEVMKFRTKTVLFLAADNISAIRPYYELIAAQRQLLYVAS